jgi:hypothetical protein
MDYDGMRRRHGREPSGKFCGDCVWAKRPRDGYEGELHCKPIDGIRMAFVTHEMWPACGYFSTPWRLERERLEQLGQRCIQFVTRGGGSSWLISNFISMS